MTFECDDDPVFVTMHESAGMSFVTKNQGVTLQNRRQQSKYGSGNQHFPFDVWLSNPELWFRNALTREIVSSPCVIVLSTVILMSHQVAAGNHRFCFFFWGGSYKPLGRTKYGFSLSALLITMATFSWIKLRVFFCEFSTKDIEWIHYRKVMS